MINGRDSEICESSRKYRKLFYSKSCKGDIGKKMILYAEREGILFSFV